MTWAVGEDRSVYVAVCLLLDFNLSGSGGRYLYMLLHAHDPERCTVIGSTVLIENTGAC